MRILSAQEFQELIEAGHETRNVEFKSAFSWDDAGSLWLREKVIQTVLGMSNTRNGGTIVIGIREDNGVPDLDHGLSDEQFQTFDRYDDIKGVIDGFAAAGFDISGAERNGQRFVFVSVREFDLVPAICKKDGQYKDKGSGKLLLQRGDIYVRAKNGTESTIRTTEAEMQEIIELAIDKGQRNLVGRGWKFEVQTPDRFKKQRGDF